MPDLYERVRRLEHAVKAMRARQEPPHEQIESPGLGVNETIAPPESHALAEVAA